MSRILAFGSGSAVGVVVALLVGQLLSPPGTSGSGSTPSALPSPVTVETVRPTRTPISTQPVSAARTSMPIATRFPAPADQMCDSDVRINELRPAAGTALDTEVALILLADRPCKVFGGADVYLRDGWGQPLAVVWAEGGADAIDLRADSDFRSQVRFLSWCGPTPEEFPLGLDVWLNFRTAWVIVDGWRINGPGELPACTPGSPTLTFSPWVASP